MKECSFPDCGRPFSCKDLCQAHYQQIGRRGWLSPLQLHLSKSLTPYERVMARAAPTDGGCLIYMGARDPNGYGRSGEGLVHRVVAEHHFGPSDLDVLHSCDNPPCVNPEHLRYGTAWDNISDAVGRGRMDARRMLTDVEVRAIRADSRPQVRIAASYSIHQSTVSRIKSGKRRSA